MMNGVTYEACLAAGHIQPVREFFGIVFLFTVGFSFTIWVLWVTTSINNNKRGKDNGKQ